MKQKSLSKECLETLIERYFAGMTTGEEELSLRRELAKTQYESESIDEARAVMGYFVMAGRVRAGRSAGIRRRVAEGPWRVAAMIAVLVTVAVTVVLSEPWHDPAAECLAYSHGRVITDDGEVSELVQMQLRSVAEAKELVASSVEGELRMFSGVFNRESM